MVNQRTCTRFKVKDRAFTKLSDNSSPYHVALIVDMSRSGMAFSYLGAASISPNVSCLDILYEDGLCLNAIPVKIISDISIERKKIPTRRCGVQFGELTPMQQSHIENFIQKYAEGTAQ